MLALRKAIAGRRHRACRGTGPATVSDRRSRSISATVTTSIYRWDDGANKQPTPEVRTDAIRIALAGLASGDEPETILAKLGVLRIRSNTFPAEVLLELASDAIDEAGATATDPIDCEKLRERLLPERPFSGKTEHHKSKYAISAAAMIHGGV